MANRQVIVPAQEGEEMHANKRIRTLHEEEKRSFGDEGASHRLLSGGGSDNRRGGVEIWNPLRTGKSAQ